MRFGLAAALAAAALALLVPFAAQAKVVTYGGKVSGGGTIALDVAVDKRKQPKKVVAIRARDVPAECDISTNQTIWTLLPKLGLKVRDGGFTYKSVQKPYGNVKRISGEFKRKGKVIRGSFAYSHHFPVEVEQGLPEEDCTTGKDGFKATRGGKDVVVPPRQAAPRRG